MQTLEFDSNPCAQSLPAPGPWPGGYSPGSAGAAPDLPKTPPSRPTSTSSSDLSGKKEVKQLAAGEMGAALRPHPLPSDPHPSTLPLNPSPPQPPDL